jgi:hypothetical protein
MYRYIQCGMCSVVIVCARTGHQKHRDKQRNEEEQAIQNWSTSTHRCQNWCCDRVQ